MAMLEQLEQWDRSFLFFLNGMGKAEYDPFWLTVTKFPTWSPLFLLIAVLVAWKRPWKQWAVAGSAYFLMMVAVFAVTKGTKMLVGRLRPINDPEILPMVRSVYQTSSFSFFSGHAAFSFSVALMAILLLRKRYRWIWGIAIWPLLFSYSRLYLGVHYPTDILTGALVGSAVAWLFYRIHHKYNSAYGDPHGKLSVDSGS